MPPQERQHSDDRDDRPFDGGGGGAAVAQPEPVGIGEPEPYGAVDAVAVADAADTSAEDAEKNRPVQTHLSKCPSPRFSAEKRFVA